MKKSNDEVFLDSNFLISLQVTRHAFFARAGELVMRFKEEEMRLSLIPLVIDEFWYIIKGYIKTDFPDDSKEAVMRKLNKATRNVLSLDGLEITNASFARRDLLNTLEIMSKYDLRPRDALIIKSMEILGVKNIATFDTDFDRVKGINVIK